MNIKEPDWTHLDQATTVEVDRNPRKAVGNVIKYEPIPVPVQLRELFGTAGQRTLLRLVKSLPLVTFTTILCRFEPGNQDGENPLEYLVFFPMFHILAIDQPAFV